MEPSLADHVKSASARTEVREAVGRVYADVQREIETRRPICSSSGRCCRFEEYGHRLYVTTLELAAFVGQLPVNSCQLPVKTIALPLLAPDNWPLATSSPGCPFQVGKLCSVHDIRPFGCRIFFCDATSTEWLNERYERFHAELKRLHATLNVPYLYVEWRQALMALGLAGNIRGPFQSDRLSLPQL